MSVIHKQDETVTVPDERWVCIECKGPWTLLHSSYTAYSPDWDKVTCRKCRAKMPKTVK